MTTSLSILLVDDDVDTSELFAEMLEMRGHVTRTAASGPAALSLLDESPADVVLLDVSLPGQDGFEVGASIRARFGEKVRLVALTGYSSDTARQRAAAAGFNGFLVKPIDLDHLEASIRPDPG